METVVISAIAVAVVCIMAITGAVLKKYKKEDALEKLKGYQGIALRIFQKVEEIIPDSYGALDTDPVLGRSVHKLNTFLQQFSEFYKKTEGGKLNEELENELRMWAQIWADRQKQVAAAQAAPTAPTAPKLAVKDGDV